MYHRFIPLCCILDEGKRRKRQGFCANFTASCRHEGNCFNSLRFGIGNRCEPKKV